MTFPEKLRELRKLAGLNQSQLASRFGCKPSYINDLEAGRRSTVTLVTLIRLAKAIGIEPKKFFE